MTPSPPEPADPAPAFTFVTVFVEEHDALPEGCCMRFKGSGRPRPVRVVRYGRETDADVADWRVLAPAADEDGAAGPAWGLTVEDSGAGTCVLVYGADRGLRLRRVDGGATDEIAEPYLLLAHSAVVAWDEEPSRR